MTALLLFPGAGSSSDHPSLVAIAAAVDPMPCRRADFPYRGAGRRAPDRPPVLLATVRAAAADLADAAVAPTGWCWAAGRWAGGSARWRWATPVTRSRRPGWS